jgi:hypothetical protein
MIQEKFEATNFGWDSKMPSVETLENVWKETLVKTHKRQSCLACRWQDKKDRERAAGFTGERTDLPYGMN